MKLTYFGTSAAEGWPALFCNCPSCQSAREKGGKSIRTRSQALVNHDLLIDFPSDTYLHVLNYGLDLNQVENVLVTHSHEDHFYPDDLACRCEGYVDPRYRSGFLLNVYGNDAVREKFEACALKNDAERMGQVVTMTELKEYLPAQVGNYTVYPLLADHNPQEKCYIYVIAEKTGKTLLYAHDTGYLRPDVWELIQKMNFHFDMVSLDCNHGKEDSEQNHMGIRCCGKVKDRLLAEGFASPETVFVVNHFSHNCLFLNHDEIEEAAAPYGMRVSYDGCSVEF